MGHGAYDEESYENIMPLSILCFRNRTVAINRTLVALLASFLHYILSAGFQNSKPRCICALCSCVQNHVVRRHACLGYLLERTYRMHET
jgi:hypothetical protein